MTRAQHVSRLLLEDGTSYLNLEQGVGALALEAPPSDVAPLPDFVTLGLEGGGSLLLEDGTSKLILEGIGGPAILSGPAIDANAVLRPAQGTNTEETLAFRTVVQETSSDEMAWMAWQHPEIRARFVPDVQTLARLSAIQAFLRGRRGARRGMLVEDPFDNSTHPQHFEPVDPTNYEHRETFGAGDGVTTTFQLLKRYRAKGGEESGGQTMVERVRPLVYIDGARMGREDRKPTVFVNGVQQVEGIDYDINYVGGEVVFLTPPEKGFQLEWAGYFLVPMRLSAGQDRALEAVMRTNTIHDLPRLELLELNQGVQYSDLPYDGGASAYSISGPEFLNFYRGRVQVVTPTVSTSLLLPSTTYIADGDPIFWLKNDSASEVLGLVDTTAEAADTTVTTLLAQQWAQLYVRSDGSWGVAA